MHQAGEFRLPPHRHHHRAALLLALQFAAQAAQIMERLLHGRRRRPGAPEVGPVHLGGDRLEHGRQFGRIEPIEVAAHQRQTQPEFVVAPQGGHGAAHLGGIEARFAIEAAEEAQDVDQGEEGVPVAVGAEVQQPLPLLQLGCQFLGAAAVLLELLAVAPAVGRVLLDRQLQLAHQQVLGLNFAGQVVAGGVHVVAAGHRGHRQGQAAALLVAMAQLAAVAQLGRLQLGHLQAAELGVEAHHRRAGQQDPDVLVGEAEQQGELT